MIIALFFQRMAIIPFLIIAPAYLNYSYGVLIISNHFNDLDWTFNLITAISALLMIGAGLIYFIKLFWPKRRLAS